MMRMVGTLFLLIAFLLAGNTTASTQERVALIIGNSAYKHTTPLLNPRNDAEKMNHHIGAAWLFRHRRR